MTEAEFQTPRGADAAPYHSPGLRWFPVASIGAMSAYLALELMSYSNAAMELFSALLLAGAIFAMVPSLRSPYAKSLWRSRWEKNPLLLDERERQVIAFAYARSYSLLLLLMFAAFLYLAASEYLTSLWIPDGREMRLIAFALVFNAGMLPLVIAEWSVSPLPADQDEV